MKLTDFTANQRIQLHPATDYWMQGQRYGTIESVGRKYLSVRLDVSGRLIKLSPDNVYEII